MTTKGLGRFGIWLLLAASPALAQIANGGITPRQHGPMRLHERIDEGSMTSDNWSGYAVTGTDFTFAKGSWHVPEVDCSVTPTGYSAFWVGIDGFSDGTVEQTGTASDCSSGTAQYYAWYEFYPAGSVVISSMPVSPGDTMGASITYKNGVFTIGIHDHTTGAEYTKSKAVPGADRTSAEWIAEAPCCTSGGGILPLADYVYAVFGEDYNADADTDYATDSSESDKPIADFGSHVQKITMVKGAISISVPTALSKDGTSFQTDYH